MRWLSSTALVLLCSAQVDAKLLPGYIVDLKGDTLRGLIDENRWERNPRRISFRKDEASQATTYFPLDIRAFQVGDRYYESAITEIDVSPAKRDQLTNDPAPDLKLDTLFLQIMIRGEKDLLFLSDQLGKVHFFIRASGRVEVLTFKQYFGYIKDAILINNQVKVIVDNSKYKQQLINHLGACPAIQQQIERTKYEEMSMVQLFTDYHTCRNKQIQIKYELKDTRFRVNIVLGATLSDVKFEGETVELYIALQRTDFNMSVNPTAGVSFETYSSRTGFGFSCDLLVTTFKVDGNYTYFVNQDNYKTTNSTFSYTYIKGIPTFSYRLLGRDQGLYLLAGGSLGFIAGDKTNVEIITKFYGPTTTRMEPFKSANIEAGYLAGLGHQFGKFSLEGRYERTLGFDTHASLRTTVSLLYLTVNYTIISR